MKYLNISEEKGLVNLLLLGTITLLAISLPIATKLVQKNQENRSNAASNVLSACDAIKGSCLDKNTRVCTGNKKWYTGKCPGGANIQCCAPNDTECKSIGGSCLDKNSQVCTGNKKWYTGKCPGGANIQCCAPDKSTSDKKIIQDQDCTNAGGTCQSITNKCVGGNYVALLCPSSGSNIKCCVPTLNSTPSSSPSPSVSPSPTIIQDSKCTDAGGTCQDIKLPCGNDKEYKPGYCPSSGSNIKCCAPKFSEYSSKVVQSEACRKSYEGSGICMLLKDYEKIALSMDGYQVSSGSLSKSCAEVNNNNSNVICTSPKKDNCKEGDNICGPYDRDVMTCVKINGFLDFNYTEECESKNKKCKDGKCVSGCKCVAFENASDYEDITGKTLCQTGTPKNISKHRYKKDGVVSYGYGWTCGDASSCMDIDCDKLYPNGILRYE